MEPIAEGLCCLLAYFLPTIVTLLQGKRVYYIFVINLFLGWTVVGWIIALTLSLINKD